MTEAEAREILRLGARDGFEAWIAGQIWIPRKGGGWRVANKHDGWTVDLAAVPEGVRIAAFLPGAKVRPAVWLVEAR